MRYQFLANRYAKGAARSSFVGLGLVCVSIFADALPDSPCRLLDGLPKDQEFAPPPHRSGVCDDSFRSKDGGLVRQDVSSLVVSIPDPLSSSLNLYFDRSFGTLLRAMNVAGFSFDRQWIPWDDAATTDLPNRPNRFTVEREEQRKARLRYPGLLLFRRSLSVPGARSPVDWGGVWDSPYVAVWLVAESPTEGLDANQFREAIRLASTYRGTRSKRSDPIAFVGPLFSGSILSLTRLVADLPSNIRLRVRSGTISSINAIEHLGATKTRDRVSFFSSMLHSDQYALCRVVEFLKETLGFEDSDIALLVESGTGFGRQAVDGDLNCSGGGGPLTLVDIPREVARLRGSLAMAKTSADTLLPLPQLGIESSRNGPGSLPIFAPEVASSVLGSLVRSILSQLDREKIRIVGIQATDVRDTILLTRLVRQHLPDVQVFVLDSDLLLVEATKVFPIEGVMTVSTYPLFGRNQNWSQSPDLKPFVRQAFGSAFETGLFNAVETIMGRPAIEFHSPHSGRSTPGLWLSAVGLDGMWPILQLDAGKRFENCEAAYGLNSTSSGSTSLSACDPLIFVAPGYNPPMARRPSLETPSTLWFTMLFLLAINLLAAIRSLRLRASSRVRFGQLHQSAVQVLYLWFLTALHCFVGFSLPAFILGLTQSGTGWVFATYLPAAIVLIALVWRILPPALHWVRATEPIDRVATISLLIRRAPAQVLNKLKQDAIRETIRIGSVFLWPTVVVYLMLLPPPRQLTLLYRCVNVGSGVSPSVPFVFVGLALCSCWIGSYRHLKNIVERLPRHARGRDADILLASVQSEFRRRRDVWARLQPPLVSWRGFGHGAKLFPLILNRRLVWPLISAILVIAAFLHSAPSVEGAIFDWGYYVCLATTLAFTSSRCANAFRLWRSLKTGVLANLEKHQIRLVFGALPPHFSSSFIWQGAGLKHIGVNRMRSVECLRNACSVDLGVHPATTVQSRLIEIMKHIEDAIQGTLHPEALAPGQKGRRVSVMPTACRLWNLLSYASVIASNHLHWQVWANPITDIQTRRSTRQEQRTSEERFNDALQEFVALRYYAPIRYAASQLRVLIVSHSFAFVFAVWSFSTYPFPGQTPTKTVFALLSIAYSVLIGRILWEFSHDPIILRISDRSARWLDRSLILKLMIYGGIPTLVVIGSLYPRFGAFIYGPLKAVVLLISK